MDNKIKNLEVKKMLKELDFIETDYEYRTEIVSVADSDFMNNINEFLSKNPELKNIYDKKINDNIEKTINDIKSKSEEVFDNTEENIDNDVDNDNKDSEIVEDEYINSMNEKSSELKKIYREIVKLTHPDKVKDKKLNDFYIKSTDLYNDNDKIGLYKICDELGISYDIDENDTDIIEDKINTLKKKISFLESTFTWKWLNTKDEKLRDKILLDFIILRTGAFQ
jgi:hypothetical protein